MRVEIVGTNVTTSPAFVEHTTDRLQSTLERFDRHVDRCTVRLSDRNGSRGGEDKVCRIVLVLHRVGTIEVQTHGRDAYAVVDRAVLKLKQAATKRLERRQERRATGPRFVDFFFPRTA
jgi:ribosomal subunit interface protein